MSKEKKQGRPRKLLLPTESGKTIDAFFDTVAAIEKAITTYANGKLGPNSDDRFENLRKIEQRFNQATGKDFRKLSERLLSVLQSRDDRRLADRRAELTRKAKGRTIKKYFEDGLAAEMCPMGPTCILADNEAEAKELRSRLEGLAVHVRAPGALMHEGEMTVNARDLQHLYRVPVSVHLNCPDDYRAEIMPVIVNEWRRIRDACNFKGIQFRNKPKSITNRDDNSDARRIYDCLQACQQADEQRGERHDEKTGKLHKQSHRHKRDPKIKIDNAERSATPQAPPETDESDYDLEFFQTIFGEVIDAVPDDVRPDVNTAFRSVMAARLANREIGTARKNVYSPENSPVLSPE